MNPSTNRTWRQHTKWLGVYIPHNPENNNNSENHPWRVAHIQYIGQRQVEFPIQKRVNIMIQDKQGCRINHRVIPENVGKPQMQKTVNRPLRTTPRTIVTCQRPHGTLREKIIFSGIEEKKEKRCQDNYCQRQSFNYNILIY